MNKFLNSAAVLAIVILTPHTAQAADAALAAAPYDWSGLYLGVEGGYGFGSQRFSERSVPTETDAANLSGILGGITAGFNMQSGSTVFGLESDISAASLKSHPVTSNGFTCVNCEGTVNWVGTVRGRLGYAIDTTMPYLTGGLAVGGVKGTATAANTVLGEGTRVGWTVGAGIEHAFSNNLSAKLEYLYTDLGRLELPTSCGTNCYTDERFSTIRIGLNYKF